MLTHIVQHPLINHRFGYARIFLVCSIQVHPSIRPLVDWAYGGLARGGWLAWVEDGHMTLLHTIPHSVVLNRDSLYIGVLFLAHTNTTVHLTGRLGLAVQCPLCSLSSIWGSGSYPPNSPLGCWSYTARCPFGNYSNFILLIIVSACPSSWQLIRIS
jgi:hypothetical protein